jgi:hypothetical protein
VTTSRSYITILATIGILASGSFGASVSLNEFPADSAVPQIDADANWESKTSTTVEFSHTSQARDLNDQSQMPNTLYFRFQFESTATNSLRWSVDHTAEATCNAQSSFKLSPIASNPLFVTDADAKTIPVNRHALAIDTWRASWIVVHTPTRNMAYYVGAGFYDPSSATSGDASLGFQTDASNGTHEFKFAEENPFGDTAYVPDLHIDPNDLNITEIPMPSALLLGLVFLCLLAIKRPQYLRRRPGTDGTTTNSKWLDALTIHIR